MKKIIKGRYEYKGYIIIKNYDYNYWWIIKKNPMYLQDKGLLYLDNTLRGCKEWIDIEVNV